MNGHGSPVNNPARRTFRVGINTEIDRKVDFDNDAAARFSLTHNYVIKELTLEQLAAEIGQHHNICNPCINPNPDTPRKRFHRKKEYCESADYVALDFDNDKEVDELDELGHVVLDKRGNPKKKKVRCDDEDYFSFEDALNDPFIKQHAGLMYPSPSDTPEWNRFRVVFPLPRRLMVRAWSDEADRVKAQAAFARAFEKIARLLIFKFKSDGACKDCSRFFYGTNQEDRVVILGGSLTDDALDRLKVEYEKANPMPKMAEFADALKVEINSDDEAERRKQYGERALRTAKRAIETAPMGERHKTRARLAYLIGGYVAGGMLDEAYALAELEASVRANTEHFNKSWKTVQAQFDAGHADPITFATCERYRLQFSAREEQKEADRTIVLTDGEIIDLSDDPPISSDPKLEEYLRSTLARASLMTKVRMMLAAELGFTKPPWRLLNAILSYERNRLSVKVITNEMMLGLYGKNGAGVACERTLRRDKKKLWEAQNKLGIELVWYLKGYETEDGRRVGSRYKSNLDRWSLEAIAAAIKKKGKYFLKDEELKAACAEVAKGIPRFQIQEGEKESKPVDGFEIEKSAEEALKKLALKFQEAWDSLDLTLGERHIRTRNLLFHFGKLLFGGADTSNRAGNRQRKRRRIEVAQIASDVTDEILPQISPVSRFARVSKVSPSSRTEYREEDENGPPDTELPRGQNVPQGTPHPSA